MTIKKHTLWFIIGIICMLIGYSTSGTFFMILGFIGGFLIGWNIFEIYKHGW